MEPKEEEEVEERSSADSATAGFIWVISSFTPADTQEGFLHPSLVPVVPVLILLLFPGDEGADRSSWTINDLLLTWR